MSQEVEKPDGQSTASNDEPTLDEWRALGSAEMHATTFVVDGKPMSFDEMQQYHADYAAATQAMLDDACEGTEIRRQKRLEDVAAGIIDPDPDRPDEMVLAAERAAMKKRVMDLL